MVDLRAVKALVKLVGGSRMSAKNWTACPQCKLRTLTKHLEMSRALEEAYGKVSHKKYLKMQEELEAEGKKPAETTLREDYHIGPDGDKFMVGYRCSCERCGFEFRFKHEVKLKLEGEKDG
jgi:hypothetical protein